jgi:hypothetical protein
MRTFLACQQSPHTYPIPAYRFWRHYLFNGLTEAGHVVLEADGVDWARGLTMLDTAELAAWRSDAWERTLDAVRAAHRSQPVDLFLSYLYPHQVAPDAVHSIRSLGVPCVNFFCDNVREFHRVPSAYRAFDLHWVPEAKALRLYREAGLPHLHAPMPCWIEPRHRHADHPEEFGPTFIGSHDGLRAELLGTALAEGASLTVRGAGWTGGECPAPPPAAMGLGRLLSNQAVFIAKHGILSWLRKTSRRLAPSPPPPPIPDSAIAAPPAFGYDYVRVTQRASVIIGVNRYPSFRFPLGRPDTYSRLRDIEAPMMGACYLTEWTDGLDQLYAPGEEIETYRTADELVAKLHLLQSDPDRRRRLRVSAQRRALHDHTIGRSITRIAERLRS